MGFNKKICGIYPTDDGQYTFVKMTKQGFNWHLSKEESWDIQNQLKTSLLLSQGVIAAVPCNWLPKESIQIPGHFKPKSENSIYVPSTLESPLDVHKENLEKNLLGIVPDDAFLCTIPQFFASSPAPDSFLSIYYTTTMVKIGIIIHNTLQIVFNLPPCSNDQLFRHCIRLERYWLTQHKEALLKLQIYSFGQELKFSIPNLIHEHITLPDEFTNNNGLLLKPVGAALTSLNESVPQIVPASDACLSRNFRSKLFLGAAIFLFFSILACFIPLMLNFQSKTNLKIVEKAYHKTLSSNKEISKLLSTTDLLIKRVEHLQNMSSQSTKWTEFLLILGNKKPKDLYFEKLGSENSPGSSKQARVAIVGASLTESSITEFIKQLQNTNFIKDVSLSIVERDSQRSEIVRFKILCTLTF